MGAYIGKRLLIMIPTAFCIVLLVFGILSLTPGTPGRAILGPAASQEAVDSLNAEFGYDRPLLTRFADYTLNALRGDFGVSYISRRPISGEIMARFPTTLLLTLLSMFFATLIGIPIGIFSAVKRYSAADFAGTSVALLLATMPPFWLGLLLMLLFSLQLGWLPSAGIGSWQHYVLPTLTLVLPIAAVVMRMTRSAMLDTLRQDYVRTARAKGATEGRVVWRHALKNALLPVVTSIGLCFGSLLGGTVLVESIFSMPGLGMLTINAIRQKDIPMVTGSITFLAILFYVVMLLVDILYAVIDPRLRARYAKDDT
jgi:peptide/nickel transport system permease protein